MTTRMRWVATRKDAITASAHELLLYGRCCCKLLQPCNGGKASAEGIFGPGPGLGLGPGRRGVEPMRGTEARQSREMGRSSEIGPLTRVREHCGSRMGRNGRRFQIDALQGQLMAVPGFLSCRCHIPWKPPTRPGGGA